MNHERPMIAKVISLGMASLLVWAAWMVLLPWLAAHPTIEGRLEFLERRGIDPSAMFYTELDAMEPVLDRIEGRDVRTFSQPDSAAGVAIRLVATDVAAIDKTYPPGPLGDVVRLGESLVNETDEHPLTKPFVGNSLKCTSCHLDGGRHPRAASFIGVAAAYPAYSPREKGVVTLEDRILHCFIRSQNGTRPDNGSKVPVAIAAYISWLSEGTPIELNAVKPLGPNHMKILGDPPKFPSLERGKSLYADRCASCHGDDGEGSDDGPPVWGDRSFNDGAGLSGVSKMASWLKVAMPLDDTDLTNQEAFDIAAFVNSHARPKFHGK